MLYEIEVTIPVTVEADDRDAAVEVFAQMYARGEFALGITEGRFEPTDIDPKYEVREVDS